MEAYLPILQSLTHADVQFAAIGTWALKAYFPEKLSDYALPDCDVVLAPDLRNVQSVIRVLNALGWETRVWGESVDASVTSAQLQGKYYLRAMQSALTLDLTYECAISWAEMQSEIVVHSGIPLASVPHILQLKRTKAMQAGQLNAFETWLIGLEIT